MTLSQVLLVKTILEMISRVYLVLSILQTSKKEQITVTDQTKAVCLPWYLNWWIFMSILGQFRELKTAHCLRVLITGGQNSSLKISNFIRTYPNEPRKLIIKNRLRFTGNDEQFSRNAFSKRALKCLIEFICKYLKSLHQVEQTKAVVGRC